MKKIFSFLVFLTAGVILTGCSLKWDTDTSTTTGVVPVAMTGTTTGEARQQCLDMYFQWNDSTATCERLDLKTACLTYLNQWDEESERCEFSEENCIAAGNQWNETTNMCEYTKEACLAMNAQWDEQKALCEIKPETSEQRLEDCLNDGGQWDYPSDTCQLPATE